MERPKNLLLARLRLNGDLPSSGKAIDVGVGFMDNIQFLRDQGLEVVGVEKDKELYEALKSKFDDKGVTLINTDISDYEFTLNSFDLVIAHNVLPDLPKKDAVAVIKRAVSGLKKNGYFIFTLFGPEDSWKGREDKSFFEYEEVLSLLKELDVDLYLQSTEQSYALTLSGEKKRCHIHSFIVQKR